MGLHTAIFMCRLPPYIFELAHWLHATFGFRVLLGSSFERCLSGYLKPALNPQSQGVIVALGNYLHWLCFENGQLLHVHKHPLTVHEGDDLGPWAVGELDRLRNRWNHSPLPETKPPRWLDLRSQAALQALATTRSSKAQGLALPNHLKVDLQCELHLGRLRKGYPP